MSYIIKTVRNLYIQKTKVMGSFRKMPDFLIIGAQRSGTSSLYYYLSQHPDTKLLRPKEVHYFDLNYNKGLLWYKNHFPFNGNKKITGEASPYYIFNPFVAKRVFEVLPEAKIIILLRNPVERAFSHYRMNVKNGIESLSFAEAIDKESERLKPDLAKMQLDEFYVGDNHRRFSYVSRGFYDEQLKNWLQYFSLDQLLIVKSEDFFEHSEKIVKRVFDFLQIRSNVTHINYINTNKGLSGVLNKGTRLQLRSLYDNHLQKVAEMLGSGFSWSLIIAGLLSF